MSPFEVWRSWGLDPHPAEAYFIALDDERVLGYGYLELDGEQWRNGFLGLARDARGRGLARAIKSAQIAWAKANGVPNASHSERDAPAADAGAERRASATGRCTPSSSCAGRAPEYPQRDSNPRYRRERPAS